MSAPSNHHLVSQGYQKGWGDDERRLTIIDPRTGDIIDRRRAIRRNFCERDFNTLRQPDGTLDTTLEVAFGRLESDVLPLIRSASATNRGPRLNAAIANLFAIHLARSPAHRAFAERVSVRVRDEQLEQALVDPELKQRFEDERGYTPTVDDITALVDESDRAVWEFMKVSSMAEHHDKAAATLNAKYVQIIEIDDSVLGSLVLGDVPVVHADDRTNRFGFTDSLAIGDSNRIMAPLTPRVAAILTEEPIPPGIVKSKRKLNALNAFLIRGALREVACRHEDAQDVQRVCRQIDRHLEDFYLL